MKQLPLASSVPGEVLLHGVHGAQQPGSGVCRLTLLRGRAHGWGSGLLHHRLWRCKGS